MKNFVLILSLFFCLSAYADGDNIDLFSSYETDLEVANNKRKDVTTRLAISGLPSQGIPYHMTITYFGDPTKESLDAFHSLTKDLSTMLESTKEKVRLQIVGRDNFGPRSEIPVFLINIVDKEIKDLFVKFHQAYGVAEPGMPSKFEEPTFHISLKGLSEENLSVLEKEFMGKEVTGEKIEAKRLGPNDSFFSKFVDFSESN
jgi:2'-5' RNA ligase